MTIIRIQHRENPYVQLDRHMIQDDRLTWSARGLLSYLLSMPVNWNVRVTDLIKRSPVGRDGLYKIIQELKNTGYITYTRPRSNNGRLGQAEYHVFEVPQTLSSPLTDIPDVETKASFSPHPAFPDLANPDREKPDTYIINRIQNKQIKKETAEADIKPEKTEQPLAASAAFSLDIFVNDLLIDETLTENQLRQVTATVDGLQESGYLTHLGFEHAIQAVTDTLLSRNTYTRAGNDFLKKLNTIKKSIQQGSWTPPVDRIVAQKTAEINALEEWKREYQSRLNEIAHLTQHIERFSEYRAHSLAKNNMTQHVDAALDSSRAQLDALTEALTEFKKTRPDINNSSVHPVLNEQHASLPLENKPIRLSQRL